VTAFTPIVEVARGPYVWLVGTKRRRARCRVRRLGALAPGQLNYASPGEGSVHHLATEMLKQAAGVDLVHVAITTGMYVPLLGGQVDAMFESMPRAAAAPGRRKLRALGVDRPEASRRVCPTCRRWPSRACPASTSTRGGASSGPAGLRGTSCCASTPRSQGAGRAGARRRAGEDGD
jgi:hypothetical protein